jgi:hypothetical protein
MLCPTFLFSEKIMQTRIWLCLVAGLAALAGGASGVAAVPLVPMYHFGSVGIDDGLAENEVVLVDHRRGHRLRHADRGRHLGWTRGKHKGWNKHHGRPH